jgi:hypothetical protein
MINSLDLTKASNSLYSGMSVISKSLEDLSLKRVPEIRTSLATLDPKSPTYQLRLKAVSGLFQKAKQDTDNLSNIIAVTSSKLQENSSDLNWLVQEVRMMELEHEMAVAGSFEKVYLRISRAINGVYSSTISAANFFKVDQQTVALAGTALLSGAVSFAAGYYLSR